MKKSNHAQGETSASWLDVEWISEFVEKYGALMAYAFLGLVTLLIIAYQFTRNRETRSFTEYMRADRVYAHFTQADLDADPEALQRLEQLMDQYPDLKQKYEGKVAQVLIAKDRTDLAYPYIERMITRSEEEGFPKFLDYTQTTLLITEEEYSAAYQRALELQPRLDSDEQLHAFNLLRLASLEQRLGLVKPELEHWEDLLAAAEENDAFKAMLSQVREGKVNLNRYIQNRVAELKN